MCLPQYTVVMCITVHTNTLQLHDWDCYNYIDTNNALIQMRVNYIICIDINTHVCGLYIYITEGQFIII